EPTAGGVVFTRPPFLLGLCSYYSPTGSQDQMIQWVPLRVYTSSFMKADPRE
ncbi:Hypothetical predicted protein, partial [Pelobates cultripes]